jgi:hypothetical protein
MIRKKIKRIGSNLNKKNKGNKMMREKIKKKSRKG